VNEEPESYNSFLLRLWRTGRGGTWKASLLDPLTGQRVGFNSVGDLFRYLRERVEISPDKAPSDRQRSPEVDHAESRVQGGEEGMT